MCHVYFLGVYFCIVILYEINKKGDKMFFVPIVGLTISFICNAMDKAENQPPKNKTQLKTLFSLIVNYKYQETADLISKFPKLIDTCAVHKSNFSSEEMTPVHVAALVGNSDALKNMLAVSQKSVNAVTQEGNAPLHLASNERVADLLLHNGAQPNQYNEHKFTPLYSALYGISSYKHAPYFGVAYCLLQYGADINKKCRFGETLLHKATSGNMSSEYAQFLLENGADGDIKDNTGNTPFDQVIEQVVQRDVFQRFGYCYYWVQHHSNDPFDVFKKSPGNFLDRTDIWNIMRDLYSTAQQQEKKRQPMSDKLHTIILKVGKNAKLYLFKRASFADLEMYFGKETIGCLREYFENLFCKDQKTIVKNKKPCVYDVDGVDASGDSLLHTAVKHKQSDIIKFLIDNKSIDCTIENNEGKLAFDYLLDKASKAAFFDALIKNFFEQKLNQKTENFVLNSLFYSRDISEKGRQYYFLVTLRNYPEKSWFFLEKGINVNRTWNGILPLQCAIQPWLKISWEKIPAINKYIICALLQHGAQVNKKMIQVSCGYMKKLLQQTYNGQKLKTLPIV